MGGKGYISEAMNSSRILSHRKITALPFSLASKQPFSIFIVPKANVVAGVISTPDNAGILVDCKCSQDDSSSNLPVLFIQWSEASIVEIPVDAINLAANDVYWGAGADVSES
jgi:hypothetical protein